MLQHLKDSIEKHAGRTAFCIEEQEYTYTQLAVLISKIQLQLAQAGGSNSRRIGIVLHNDLETYASVFACWFCGYAYVPLNPRIPQERNHTVIKEGLVDVILTSEKEALGFEPGIIILNTKAENTSIPVQDAIKVASCADDDLMYILFTSGSTGVPKGVPINYKNVKAFLDSYFKLGFACNEEDRFLQMFDLTFDVSVASFLVPVYIGAAVYTVPSSGIKYMSVYKIMKQHKVTFASVVPSIINYLKPYYAEISLPSLRYCILTAEASDVSNISLFADCIPSASIVNLYGPTEGTIWCTGYTFNKQSPKSYHNMLCIGKPFANVKALIQTEAGTEAAINEKGELCIAGNQITTGYLNNKEKNNTSFFTNAEVRYYKTGDLCYKDDDGDIVYCGRLDYQVKIQGFRVELSEIEVTAKQLFNANAAAVALQNNKSAQELFLFVENGNMSEDAVKKELGNKLPYYMIPSKVILVEELPYNNSGKVDRVRLKELVQNNFE
jgi:D-alanine--poly(phosphoribitol) ligase subunit 1